MPNTKPCASCGGDRIVSGSIESRGPIEKRAMFHPKDSKLFRLSLDGPYIPIPRDSAYLCVDCGLIWNSISDLDGARDILKSWGTEQLKAELDLDQ